MQFSSSKSTQKRSEGQTPLRAASVLGESANVGTEHRIDGPHGRTGSRKVNLDRCENSPSADALCAEIVDTDSVFPEHAADLIHKLQVWSQDLDRREADLNARLARIDHDERTARMKQQSQAVDYVEQTRTLERQRAQLRAEIQRMQIANIQLS